MRRELGLALGVDSVIHLLIKNYWVRVLPVSASSVKRTTAPWTQRLALRDNAVSHPLGNNLGCGLPASASSVTQPLQAGEQRLALRDNAVSHPLVNILGWWEGGLLFNVALNPFHMFALSGAQSGVPTSTLL
ncbi:hypothetical protein J6590_061990 [Homalodisca vitripennis]|nr:hypothetical protein J6590_061990 [Homalodisca vitripennis]